MLPWSTPYYGHVRWGTPREFFPLHPSSLGHLSPERDSRNPSTPPDRQVKHAWRRSWRLRSIQAGPSGEWTQGLCLCSIQPLFSAGVALRVVVVTRCTSPAPRPHLPTTASPCHAASIARAPPSTRPPLPHPLDHCLVTPSPRPHEPCRPRSIPSHCSVDPRYAWLTMEWHSDGQRPLLPHLPTPAAWGLPSALADFDRRRAQRECELLLRD